MYFNLNRLSSPSVQEFKKYKSSLLYIGIVNLFFKHINNKVPFSVEDPSQIWTEILGNYIRHNDIVLMESCRQILKEFEEELMLCEDWNEMFDVIGNLNTFYV